MISVNVDSEVQGVDMHTKLLVTGFQCFASSIISATQRQLLVDRDATVQENMTHLIYQMIFRSHRGYYTRGIYHLSCYYYNLWLEL